MLSFELCAIAHFELLNFELSKFDFDLVIHKSKMSKSKSPTATIPNS